MNLSNPLVNYFRNFIFGVEDSLVSTVGLLSGIAIASVPGKTIFLTGVILIFVEAFSMAVGSFLSDRSAAEYDAKSEVATMNPIIGSVIMFISYFVSGFVPLLPYVFLEPSRALTVSIIASLIALFALGVIGAKLSNTRIIRSGLRMMIIGGIAILGGVGIGQLIA